MLREFDWVPKKDPWDIPEGVDDEVVVYAFRALFAGTATAGQQHTIVEWLRYACGYNDQSFRPGGLEGQRATDFAEGKRAVFAYLQLMLHPSMTPKPKPKQG